jgi:hypothetical protein
MAAASSPNPMNLLLLAGVGIAAFWAFSRMRGGSAPVPIYPTPTQNAQAVSSGMDDAKALRYQLTAGLIGKAFDAFGVRAAGGNPYSLSQGNASWGVPLQSDGVAYNPSGNLSAQDSIYSLVGAWKS